MDNYWQNNGQATIPKATRLIKMLFGILIGIISLCIIGLFTFEINESSEAKQGEIIAKNPPIEYLAPYDIEDLDIRVRAGDFVYQGDTLAILGNNQVIKDYVSTEHEIEMLEDNIAVYEKMASNLKKKSKYIRKNKYTLKKRQKSSTQLNQAEKESLEEQIKAAKQEYFIAKKNYNIDRGLYKEKVIAKRAFDKSEQAYLAARRTFKVLSKNSEKETIKKEDIKIDYTSKINAERLKSLNAEQEYLNAKKEIINLKKALRTARANQQFQEKQLEQQYIIAQSNGFVQFLFNSKNTVNIFQKGASLMIVTPREKQAFYAKLELSQQAIKSVKINQTVHLELDAYDALKYGVTKGTITYVSEGDKENKFHVLAEITTPNSNYQLKNGYKTKAKIILDRVPLYDFILRRLFTEESIYTESETKPQAKN